MTARSISRSVSGPFARSIVGRIIASPADEIRRLLFNQGQQGGLYYPKPVADGQQVLYQDAGATIPVTVDGDPVGWMRDLSGNGNHATQSTSASRPTYRTDGVLHWLEGDEVDDFIDVGYPSIMPQPLTQAGAFQLASANASADIFDTPGDASGIRTSLLVRSSEFQIFAGTLLSTGINVDTQKHIAIATYNHTNSEIDFDGDTTSGDAGSRGADGFSLGSESGVLQGKVFGALTVDKVLSDQEKQEVKAFFANLAGVQL